MFFVIALLLIGVAPALAADGPSTASCNAESENRDPKFQGVLDRLKGTASMSGKFVCSAALVTFKGRPGSARGLVLTAGHCSERGGIQIRMKDKTLGAPDAGEILYRLTGQRSLSFETGNSAAPRTCIETDQIIYGTLTDADVLLLRLTDTYEQIEARTGVKPFMISEDRAFPIGTPVRSPSSLFQSDRECSVEAIVEGLKEGRWLWGPVMRLSMSCDIPHGLSGAPLVRLDSNEVIGVIGTASDGDAAPCEFNNPCEMNAQGTTTAAQKDQGYAHFVHRLYTCLDANRDINVDLPGCLLPKPAR
jgi:hypothetical protein